MCVEQRAPEGRKRGSCGIFRPSGADSFVRSFPHGLRRGLAAFAPPGLGKRRRLCLGRHPLTRSWFVPARQPSAAPPGRNVCCRLDPRVPLRSTRGYWPSPLRGETRPGYLCRYHWLTPWAKCFRPIQGCSPIRQSPEIREEPKKESAVPRWEAIDAFRRGKKPCFVQLLKTELRRTYHSLSAGAMPLSPGELTGFLLPG